MATWMQEHARFAVGDEVVVDCFIEDPEEGQVGDDLLVVWDEPYDFDGSFTCLTMKMGRSLARGMRFTLGEHVGASPEYLNGLTPAPEDVAKNAISAACRLYASNSRRSDPLASHIYDEWAEEILEAV